MKEKVYDYLLTIPKGKVITYSQLATAVGHPKAARAIGNILHNNKYPDYYPCFKVVNCKGMVAKSFAFGGSEGQIKRLKADGIEVKDGKVDLKKYGIHNI